MKNYLAILLLILLINPLGSLFGQVKNKDLVQFTGVVVTGDSLDPVPFAHIIVKNTNRGTITDYYGFFSFVARKNDTIIFTSVGYKRGLFVIPDTITDNKYSLIQIMTTDTVLLKETVIYPWPSVEQFKQAFLSLDVPDDDYERAMKNLALAELKERAQYTPMDGSTNYRNYMQQQTSRLYYVGQAQPISLLNPFAWAEFIKAWKRGDFKKQEE